MENKPQRFDLPYNKLFMNDIKSMKITFGRVSNTCRENLTMGPDEQKRREEEER